MKTIFNLSNKVPQLLLGLIISILLAIIVQRVDSSINTILAAFFVVILFVFLYSKYLVNNTIAVNLLYGLIVTSFLQGAVVPLDIGFFALMPYRIFFILVGIIFLYQVISRQSDFGWENIQVKPMFIFLGFWLFYNFLSLTWVHSLIEGIKYTSLLVIGIILIFFITFYFKKVENYVSFFYIWLVMFVVLSAIGVWNYVTGKQLPKSALYHAPEVKKHIPSSVFHNPNDFATYLVVCLFLLLAFIKYQRNTAMKFIGAFSLLLGLFLLYETSSRASFIGVALGIVAWVFISLGKSIKEKLLIYGVPLFFAFLMIFYDKIYNIISAVLVGFFEEGSSVAIRTNLIKNSFYFISNSFGFGVGAGNAEYHMESNAIYPTSGIYNVHNWWVEIATNFGMLIIAGYIIFYLAIIISLYKINKTSNAKMDKMISEGLFTSLIAFSFACISPSSMINLFYLWVLIAFCVGYINASRSSSSTSI